METSNHESKPKIIPLPNGPLYLLNDSRPQSIDNLVDFKGEPLSTVVGIALCRCGQSKNKPFCDGTHNTVGFTSNNSASDINIKDKRRNYANSRIIVHDNRRICSHSAECLRNLPSVFRLDERPWINVDGAAVEKIVETVRNCPSGALSYSIDGIEHRDQDDRKPMVTVAKNGPYNVTGGVELVYDDAVWAEGASKEHYALCRCGASNNKPFCDGTHLKTRFRDDKR